MRMPGKAPDRNAKTKGTWQAARLLPSPDGRPAQPRRWAPQAGRRSGRPQSLTHRDVWDHSQHHELAANPKEDDGALWGWVGTAASGDEAWRAERAGSVAHSMMNQRLCWVGGALLAAMRRAARASSSHPCVARGVLQELLAVVGPGSEPVAAAQGREQAPTSDEFHPVGRQRRAWAGRVSQARPQGEPSHALTVVLPPLAGAGGHAPAPAGAAA